MKRTKTQKGITLIALLITIVILLILAAVAISSITNDGIIHESQGATSKHEIAQEKENIQLTIDEWSIGKYFVAGKTFEEFLGEKFGASNVVDNGDETYNVTVESGNIYKIQENGTIIQAKGVSVAGTGMPLMLEEGATVTGTLTATLVGISGEITWSNENNEVATISATTGASVTVTAVAKGETKVTATCSGYTAVYTVKVKEPATLKVGSYVEYDVSYTDMYQGTEYTSTNGWRYLGTESGTGNHLLISTAIPVVLYYKSSTAGENAKWWDTDTTLNANVRATNGMINNFAKIPYTQTASGTSVSTANTAIGRFAGKDVTVDGTTYTAIGDTFKSSTYSSKIENVRTLTLDELKAANWGLSSGFKELKDEAIGLFDMQDLGGYTANYDYWLASPDANNTSDVYFVYSGGSFVSNSNWDRNRRASGSGSII